MYTLSKAFRNAGKLLFLSLFVHIIKEKTRKQTNLFRHPVFPGSSNCFIRLSHNFRNNEKIYKNAKNANRLSVLNRAYEICYV